MFDFHEKRKLRSYVYSKFSIGVLVLLAIFMSLGVYERFSVEREMAEKRAQKEIELESLKTRATALESQVDSLKDDRGMEAELRSRFDIAKEGEQVVVIVDDEKIDGSEKKAASTSPEVDRNKKNWFDWLWSW